MQNNPDILTLFSPGIVILFGGLLVVFGGVFSVVTMKVRVGFRGMHPLFLTGANAQKVGIADILGGIILSVIGFLSWLLKFPTDLLLILC